jgi:hypothetical protein
VLPLNVSFGTLGEQSLPSHLEPELPFYANEYAIQRYALLFIYRNSMTCHGPFIFHYAFTINTSPVLLTRAARMKMPASTLHVPQNMAGPMYPC